MQEGGGRRERAEAGGCGKENQSTGERLEVVFVPLVPSASRKMLFPRNPSKALIKKEMNCLLDHTVGFSRVF